jgi:hypothetical protein
MEKLMQALPVNLKQLINTIKQLQPSDRAQVAKALIEMELQSDLTALITELYSQNSIDEITDSDIMNEIKAVRQCENK